MKYKIREVKLSPYRKGMGPTFRLRIYDIGRYGDFGREYLAYDLDMFEEGRRTRIFEGDDFSPGAGVPSDSDQAVAGLLGFLTLQPGDTDEAYFETYTPRQLAWASEHAEALQMESIDRFGED